MDAKIVKAFEVYPLTPPWYSKTIIFYWESFPVILKCAAYKHIEILLQDGQYLGACITIIKKILQYWDHYPHLPQ